MKHSIDRCRVHSRNLNQSPRCQRVALAEDPDTPPSVLKWLAVSGDIGNMEWVVRGQVACHPSCPPEALLLLATTNSDLVRWHVVNQPVCPPEALAILAENGDSQILDRVRCHPNCPDHIRIMLILGR